MGWTAGASGRAAHGLKFTFLTSGIQVHASICTSGHRLIPPLFFYSKTSCN